MFSVRQPTWHGLEELMPEYPSRDVAQTAAGHKFDVIRESLYRREAGINDLGHPYDYYTLYEDAELNVRSDTGLVLSTVPTERIDVQPQEVWDLAEWVQSNIDGIQFETAGTLNEGRNIWLLMKRDRPLEIKGDPQGTSLPYFALQNGYINGVGFRFQQILTRIVCWNTSQRADFEADRNNFSFSLSHTRNLWERIEELKEAMAAWEKEAEAWVEAKEHLATLPVSANQTNWFVDAFIPMPHAALLTDRVKENIEEARIQILEEMYSSRGLGIEGTALGLFEAASSWSEHIRRAQSPQSRFKRAIIDRSNMLQDASTLAIAASHQ